MINKILEKKIIELFRNTQLSQKEIAKKTGTSQWIVWNILNKNNVRRKTKKELAKENKYLIRDILEDKMSYSDIGNKYGYKMELIREVAEEIGHKRSKETIRKITDMKIEKLGGKEYHNRIKEKREQTCLERYGTKHASQNEKIKQKEIETNLRKYGVKSTAQLESVKQKAKETNLRKYGKESYTQTEEYIEKTKKTNLEKFGTEWSSQSKKWKDKVKATNREKYGVDWNLSSDEVKKKIEKTNIERYGTKYPTQNEDVKNKTKQTNLEKYGVEFVLQDPDIREQIRKTFLERYGGVGYESEEIRKKIDKTVLKKYGVKNIMLDKGLREKIKKILLEKYGVDNPFKSKEILEKAKKTNLEKYGVESNFARPDIKEKIKETRINKYGVPYYTQTEEYKEKTKATNQKKYGVDWVCQRKDVKLQTQDSQANINFKKKLENENIIFDREFSVKSYTYDFKVDKLLIEIDPSITHNSTFGVYGLKPKDKFYHYNKSKTAEENGYHCIHIWDWDDQDKIIRLFLQDKKKIYARDCELKKVDLEEAYSFLKEYHLQGYANCELALGLYKGNELVSIMTFGKPRYNKNYDYEIIRLCSKYNVIGGNEKLFKGFIEKNKGSVISYCDSSKFNGEVYKKLGFTLKKSSISKHWYNIKTGKHITDNLLRQRGFDQLMNEHYGKGTSNEELMRNAGFVEIYDVGQQSWVYDKNANN